METEITDNDLKNRIFEASTMIRDELDMALNKEALLNRKEFSIRFVRDLIEEIEKIETKSKDAEEALNYDGSNLHALSPAGYFRKYGKHGN